MSEQECLTPGMKHTVEFVEAAFGQHSFKCILCGAWFDEPEDALVG